MTVKREFPLPAGPFSAEARRGLVNLIDGRGHQVAEIDLVEFRGSHLVQNDGIDEYEAVKQAEMKFAARIAEVLNDATARAGDIRGCVRNCGCECSGCVNP